MLFFRAAIFYLGYWLFILVYGVLSFPMLMIPRPTAARIMVSWNGFILFWLKLCCGVGVKVEGSQSPLPDACVIVANHQSPWETFFFQLRFFPLSTILKKELLNLPFFGWGLRVMDPIAIDRSHPVQALKQIKKVSLERLKNNKRIIIFPEGTRMPADQLGTYKRSAADIAQEAGVPLIPVAHNAGKFWLNKKIIKIPGTIQVFIGEPLDVAGKNTKQVMEEIQAWTQQHIATMNKTS